MEQVYNGRIDLNNTQGKPYKLYDENCDEKSFTADALKGTNIEVNPLSKLFFSKMNFDALQHGIRYSVYKHTKGRHTIDNQSRDELLTIMRSVYLQYSRNLEVNLVQQVKELNGMVLEYSVPRIINEIDMYVTYRQDIQTLPTFLDRSKSESVKGTKTIEMYK